MEREMSKKNYFLKAFTILFLSVLLLLPTLMLEGKEAKAAPVSETRSANLSNGNVMVSGTDEVVRIHQTTASTANNIEVAADANVKIILENLNIIQSSNDAAVSPVKICDNARVTVYLKGKNRMVQNNPNSSGFYLRNGASVIIEDYGNGDGSMEVSNGAGKNFKHVVLGASAQAKASLTINSGSVKAITKGRGPAIGATAGNSNAGGSTLDLVINGGTVEALTEDWGAAIGTQGDTPRDQENTVNVTINGGKVIASNYSNDVDGTVSGRIRGGAVIGTGYGGSSKQNVTLNIPESSTAKLDLTSHHGGAAIGGSGSWNTGADTFLNTDPTTHENVVANIAGGNTKITVNGQGPGIGIGAGVDVDQKVAVNISGGNIDMVNNTATNNSRGPGIGIGLFSKNRVLDCNISGGKINVLSEDSRNGDGITINAPAIGIAAKYKGNTTVSLGNSSGNTFNLNVTGGTINAETRTTDKNIPDIGTIANNTFNVKVDGGSLNAVNGRMYVPTTNSQGQRVYPATVNLGGIKTGDTEISSASISGKSYGKDLVAQNGKLYLWTTPGENKAITASVKDDSRAYSNPAVILAYNSGFTFTDPDVTLKKTITPEELGSFNIKNVGDNSVTVQVGGVINSDDQPVLLQAYERSTGTAVGEAQTYDTAKTDYTFSGLTKGKLYDIKAKVNGNDTYNTAEKIALVVKPFEYAPSLPNAKLKGTYEASVAAEGGNFTYALAEGAVLPEGLTLNENGMISGAPTEAGDFSVNIIATAADEGVSANNSRTASVAIKVEPIKVSLSVVDQAGQPLNCGCELTSTAANGAAAVGDTVLFTLTPCPLHDFVKFNLNGNDVQAVSGANGKFTYSYVVKATDNELNMKAFMTESEKRITKIERVGDEKELTIFANDQRNESLAQLKAFVNNSITLKATYNDSTEKTGKATDLGLAWATNSTYSPKGGTYEYSVYAEATSVKQAVTVNRVSAELGTLNDVLRSVSEEGYPTIAALGLPETIACTYQAGVPVNSADRELAISWTTEVPENFGKTATEAPVVFEGSAAVPEWATIENNVVSVNVSISDRVALAPVITIEDKIYDGTKTASFKDTPVLNSEDLTQGTDVQLSGIPKAEFSSADAGNNIPVKVSGLSLSGADADKYILDLSNAVGNITPATITLTGISMEDKTVTEDGSGQTIDIKGDLPSGVTVSYSYLKDGESQASSTAPTKAGSYTVTAAFKTDANHVVEPETMSAKLVIEEKSTAVVVEEIKTDLTGEQAGGMSATVLKNGEAVQVGDSVVAGDKLTYQFEPKAVREAYVPYAFTMNGETVEVTKLAEGKGYSAEYTVKEGDTALKADAKCVLLGNFSGDDKINIIDAQKIAQAAAAGEAIENMQKTAGDVNFDGKINIIDAQKIAQYAADTSSVF
ncbi:YDG domain-containing protein [Eubacterium callanderi]|uniref:YDG domain-containing protein n=1 Tax=Eubacterium callanderi TaxID=53442 RepID=UPI00391B84B1